MAAGEIESRMNACMEYELRDKSGNLKGVGKQFIDKRGRLHLVQKDGKGKVVGEVIRNRDGTIKEILEGDSLDKSAINALVDGFKRAFGL